MQGMAGNAAQTSRESHVTQQISRLESNRKALNEQIGMLENRLGPILRGNSPSPVDPRGDRATPEREQLVGLAQVLADSNADLEHIIQWVQTINSRTEL
jgi:hypothetical protein